MGRNGLRSSFARRGLGKVLATAVAIASLGAGCSSMGNIVRLRGSDEPAATPRKAESVRVEVQPLAPVRRDVYTRSYRVGETYDSARGETMVSVKNYSVTERVGRATALAPFQQECRRRFSREPRPCDDAPLASVRGAAASVFDVVGAVEMLDGSYFVVHMPSDGKSETFLLVDPNGRLRRGDYVAWREPQSHGFALGRLPVATMTPDFGLASDVALFAFETVERFVYMGPGYLSFDWTFLGTRTTPRGDVFVISYREFGRDSGDSPSFVRTAAYPVDQKEIAIGALRAKIEAVGDASIRFQVVADDQPPPPPAK